MHARSDTKSLEGSSPIVSRLRAWLPILTWLPAYRRADLPADLRAGLTTAIMLIPQAMAYAMLAGLPPIHGLYAATIPLLAYAMLGTSPQLAVGPVAMDSLLVAVGVGALASVGTQTYLAYAILLAAMVGLIQLLMGLVRVGFLVDLLSRPVISGFTSAAALIIGVSQLQHLLGVELGRSTYVHEVVIEAGRRVAEISPATLVIGVASVVVLVVLRRLRPELPRALVVVVVGTVAVWLFDLDARGVAIVGEVPSGLPRPALPMFDLEVVGELAPTAMALAFVSFLEAIVVAKAVAAKDVGDDSARADGPRVDPNRELIGLGAANSLGSLFGGYPVAGGLSRTAVNAQAGARTQLAGIITAGVVVLTLVLLTPLFHYLPKATLAAIIMTAVFGLVDVDMIRKLWALERTELAMLALTFAATLGLGIVAGVGTGAVASLLWFALRQSRPHVAVLGRVPGTTLYRDLERFDEAIAPVGVLVVRVDAQLYFGNVEFLARTLEEQLEKVAAEGQETRALIIDAGGINRLDSSAEAGLRNIDRALAARGVTLHFAGLKGPVRDMMERSGLHEHLGGGRTWATVHEAAQAV